MTSKKLTREFYNRDTRIVAKDLLGKFLVRKIGGKEISVVITETEAYCGPNDLASHASRLRRPALHRGLRQGGGFGGQAHGRTPRTEVMFGKPGLIYVYLIYGMYHCLNIVTECEDYPAAVLIRGAVVNQKLNIKHQNDKLKVKNNDNKKLPITDYGLLATDLNGPGKLCRHFQIDRTLNKNDITGKELWIEDRGIIVKPNRIKSGSRIGVDYAGKYKDKKWRYYVKL